MTWRREAAPRYVASGRTRSRPSSALRVLRPRTPVAFVCRASEGPHLDMRHPAVERAPCAFPSPRFERGWIRRVPALHGRWRHDDIGGRWEWPQRELAVRTGHTRLNEAGARLPERRIIDEGDHVDPLQGRTTPVAYDTGDLCV